MDDNGERFLNALEHYLECKREHDEAREKYESSWGWHGYEFINRMNAARQEVYIELKKIIASQKDG